MRKEQGTRSKEQGARNKEQGIKNKDPSSHLPFIHERTSTNTETDYVVTGLALTDPTGSGLSGSACKFVIRSKAVRWERALAGFPGQTVGGENQAQPVLMTNVGGQEPGTFGKPLIFGSFHQGKELGHAPAMRGRE